jgi:hypothetical protein
MDIKDVGSVTVDKKLECSFKVTADKFFSMFPDLVGNLSSDLANIIRQAIDSGKSQKLGKYQDEAQLFFNKVQQRQASAGVEKKQAMGFAADEKADAATAEKMKGEQSDSKKLTYHDGDSSSAGIETYDNKTGKKEGTIYLGEKGAEGALVPLVITETVHASYEFNAEESKEEDRKVVGEFKIINPSEKNRIWDVDIAFEKNKPINLDDKLAFRNIEPKSEEKIEYTVEDFVEPGLKINEFISTLNDENQTSYSLAPSVDNTVLFRLKVTNKEEYPLKNVKITKGIPTGGSGIELKTPSKGSAEKGDDGIVWSIDQLEAGEEVGLDLTLVIKVDKAEEKIRTGTVKAEYLSDNAFSGVKIKSFDAYSDNFVGLQDEQEDDNPDKYLCNVIFENKSDFQMKLVNLDIKEAKSQKKVLDIDPGEIPTLAAGARWESVPWEVEVENGEEPIFYKTVEFYLVADHQINTAASIAIDDIELAVALLAGTLHYSATQIPSFREIPFNTLMQVKNIGGADFDSLIMEEVVQPGFVPPTADKVELFVVRPPDDMTEEDKHSDAAIKDANWNDLGESIEIDPALIEITPEGQDPTVEHIVRIKLENLRDSPIGMVIPGMIVRAKYPLVAMKVPKGEEFHSNVTYTANTFPAGSPIVVKPEGITIPVMHIRKKTLKGKEVRALPGQGAYEINVFLENTSEFPLEQVVIKDVVPHNFEYADLSVKPTKFERMEQGDVLVWAVDKIEAGSKFDVKFKITGSGDYKASDAQFSV